MKIKTIVTTALVIGTFGVSAIAEPDYRLVSKLGQLEQYTKVKQISKNKNRFSSVKTKAAQDKYFTKNAHEGKKRYIVRLIDDSVASYGGGVKGLEAVNLTTKKSLLNNVPFNPKSAAAKKYASYLDKQQKSFIAKASSKLGYSIPNLRSFKYAINGLVTELTFDEARRLGEMSEVAFVEQDELMPLNTDTGPILIGAPQVWDGTAGSSEYMGEGVIIGIIDTGINTDHRSYAATGDDAYTVINPLGDNVYLGDCVADPTLCNSKLIGVRSYSVITDVYAEPIFENDTRPANGEDYNGHGSHTSSTAGGNVLDNVPFVVNDFLGGNTGDGIVTSFIYPRMSGVAPHANIISYQVCWPGNRGDTYTACPFSATVQAIDDAILDDVDVINFSIGHNPSSWTSSVELGFLSAQAAGVFVATSAGNAGSDPMTTDASAPWYTSVAATAHGNADVVGDAMSIGTFTGGAAALADISGAGLNGTFTGGIVWAGDFTNSNDPDGDPAQCLQPFPAGTFTVTQIVVCDRGAIARVEKAANAASGGAGGFVLANIQGGASSTPGDFYVIPGIHINADNGDALRAWLASGTGHQGTISAANLVRSTNTADEMASFSSRGPNGLIQIVSPQIAAPGHRIYAAYADDQPFMDVTLPDPKDFTTISGTSMASPHIAGAAALVTQAQPGWNPDQIRSALMMTATTAVTKNDDGSGSVATDAWDTGAGRVQVNLAVNAGLVMSESEANYLAANPDDEGDPRTLNIPSMANFGCGVSCSWTRIFTTVSAGTYAFSSAEAALTVVPASIDAVVGESYSVTFTVDVVGLETGDELFTQVDIASTVSPDLHLPVYVEVNNGAVPDEVNIRAGRNDGSYSVSGVQSIPTDDLTFTLNGLFDANATGVSESEDFDIAVDSTNNLYKDDLFQVFVVEFEVSANSATMNIAISDSTSTDNDLFIEFDSTGDGAWELFGFAATAATDEVFSANTPPAGLYRAIVQNYASASGLASDTGTLTIEVVPITDPLPGLSIEAPETSDGIAPLDVKLVWDRDMEIDDSFFGDITVAAGETIIGNFPITLKRVEDDVSISTTTQGPIPRGEIIDYTIVVNPNLYKDELAYTIDVDLPDGSSIVAGSVVADGGDVTVKNPNAEGLDLTSDFAIKEDPTTGSGQYRDVIADVHVFEFDVPSGTLSLTAAISGSTSPDNDLWIEFDEDGSGDFATLVGFAATAATNEVATIGAPAEGRYRAIVQNFDDSEAGATDTGTLSITSIPATGEGIIWEGTALQIRNAFTVVSSANEPMCANAGFGGYTPLENFNIGTADITGDSTTWSVFANNNFPFYGVNHSGISFTDDGFAFFSGSSGLNPWVNTAIPNAAEPNNMIAMFWRDLEVFEDGTATTASTRGIRLVLAGGGTIPIIEFDELGSFENDADKFSFELFAFTQATDAPGDYEYIVAYSATQVGDFTGAVAGVENADGSSGVDTSSLIQPGVQLCYDAVRLGFEISFSVQTTLETDGNPTSPEVLVTTDLLGTNDWNIEGAAVSLVNIGPVANAGEDTTYDRSTAQEVALNAVATVDLDGDRLSYKWVQTGGKPVLLRAPISRQAFFDIDKVSNGDYSFELTVSDTEFFSTDTVKITITGEDTSSGGGGSIGTLFVLLVLPLWMRRRYKK